MMDVNYFLDQAQNSTQEEFELYWADVIHVFDTNQTELITEDGKELIIYWYSDGHYQGYQVIEKPTSITAQMGEDQYTLNRVNYVIGILKNLTHKGDCVDGETMQYILSKVGMEDQMLRQLVMSGPFEQVKDLWEERRDWEEEYN